MNYITSKRQKAVLALRLELLARGVPAPKVEADMMEKLRDPEISPAQLAPVLVRRNHEDHYSAAYLLERISDRSYRLLVTDQPRWKIVRAKATSHVIVLAPHRKLSHHDLVLRQSALRFDIGKLLAKEGKACPTTDEKASTRRRSAKRTSRNSSQAKR